MPYSNNKRSAQFDQHLVVRHLDSITAIVAISEIPRLRLALVAEQAGLSLAILSAHLVSLWPR